MNSILATPMILTLLGCPQNPADQLHDPKALFTISAATRILGEPAYLSDSSTAIEAEAATFSCAYTADSTDPQTSKTCAIYFMFEEYESVRSAEKSYSSIYRSNKGHDGVSVIDDLGDEAYFHSDRENFYFILVRKGNRMLRMKVNKITSHSSLGEFNAVAREITAEI